MTSLKRGRIENTAQSNTKTEDKQSSITIHCKEGPSEIVTSSREYPIVIKSDFEGREPDLCDRLLCIDVADS